MVPYLPNIPKYPPIPPNILPNTHPQYPSQYSPNIYAGGKGLVPWAQALAFGIYIREVLGGDIGGCIGEDIGGYWNVVRLILGYFDLFV